MQKTNYEVVVSDTYTMDSPYFWMKGTNKEVLLREGMKVARRRKTRLHWKNNIKIRVDLFNETRAIEHGVLLPIKTMKF